MSEYLERIADLTKVNAVYQEKIRSLEAKLAQVKEWRNLINGRASEMTLDNLDAILSDTRKPLAVEEGWYTDESWWTDDVGDKTFELLKEKYADHVPVTVIVMPKEDADGD